MEAMVPHERGLGHCGIREVASSAWCGVWASGGPGGAYACAHSDAPLHERRTAFAASMKVIREKKVSCLEEEEEEEVVFSEYAWMITWLIDVGLRVLNAILSRFVVFFFFLFMLFNAKSLWGSGVENARVVGEFSH
jgi:hypothetical protein